MVKLPVDQVISRISKPLPASWATKPWCMVRGLLDLELCSLSFDRAEMTTDVMNDVTRLTSNLQLLDPPHIIVWGCRTKSLPKSQST
jgi:hypothetical protein